jgi:DNA (cytosine-5)-methyltransferase 1
LTHDKGNTFKVIVKSLKKEGYDLHYKVLDSSDYGVPQVRKRIYIVGFKESLFEKQPIYYWPNPKKNKIGIGKFVEKNIDGYEISKKLQESYIYKLDDGRLKL